MVTVIASGLRAARRRWPVAAFLLFVNLAFGLIFTVASWSWLSIALDRALPTRTLLTDLDVNVFVDLFVHHQGSLRMLMTGGALLAAVFVLFSVWATAGAVAAVGEEGTLAECASRGVQLYPKFLCLWFVASFLHAASIAASFLIGRALAHWVAESSAESTFYWATTGSLALGVFLVFFVATLHDHARIRVAATDSGVLHACAWAVAFVVVREVRALPLAALLLAIGGGLWLVYQTTGLLIPTTFGPGIGLSLLCGQILLLGRMFLRVWLLAAETELQRVAADARS